MADFSRRAGVGSIREWEDQHAEFEGRALDKRREISHKVGVGAAEGGRVRRAGAKGIEEAGRATGGVGLRPAMYSNSGHGTNAGCCAQRGQWRCKLCTAR